jgi:RecJ-like exonuclease
MTESRMKICEICGGRGKRLLIAAPGSRTCERCDGTGKVPVTTLPEDPRLRHEPEREPLTGLPVDPRLRHRRGKRP